MYIYIYIGVGRAELRGGLNVIWVYYSKVLRTIIGSYNANISTYCH